MQFKTLVTVIKYFLLLSFESLCVSEFFKAVVLWCYNFENNNNNNNNLAFNFSVILAIYFRHMAYYIDASTLIKQKQKLIFRCTSDVWIINWISEIKMWYLHLIKKEFQYKLLINTTLVITFINSQKYFWHKMLSYHWSKRSIVTVSVIFSYLTKERNLWITMRVLFSRGISSVDVRTDFVNV